MNRGCAKLAADIVATPRGAILLDQATGNRLKHATRTSCSILFTALLLLLQVAFAHAQEAPEGQVDTGMIELRIEAVEAATSLDEQVAATLIDLYRRALVNLDRERLDEETAAQYAAAGQNAADGLLAVQREINRLRESLPEAGQWSNPGASETELGEALATARSALDSSEAEQASLRDQYARELGRPGPARDRLAEARTQRDKAALAIDNPQAEIPEIAEARRLYRESRIRSLDAEIRKLEQELLTHEPRLALLAAQLEQAGLQVSHARARARAIEDAISARSGAAAEQALQEALTTREELEDRHPSTTELATGNVALSDQLSRQVDDIQRIADERDTTQRKMAHLNEELSSTRAKLAIAGLNQALGQLLIDQRRALPNPRSLQNRIRKREGEAADVGLRQIDHAEQLRAVSNRERYLQDLLAPYGGETDGELRSQLEGLVDDRERLLEQSIDSGVRYLRVLGELDLAERQLADAVTEYRDFLDTKLLWVRNTPPIDRHAFTSLPTDVDRFVDGSNWAQFGRDLWETARERPWQFLVIVLLIALGLARGRFLARADACDEHIGRIRLDRFSDSIRAVAFTLAASIPLPLALFAASSVVAANIPSETFTVAICIALARSSMAFLLIQAFFDLGRDRGVLLKHCGWPPSTVHKLRGEFAWFRFAYPLSLFLTQANFSLDAGSSLGSLTLLGSAATVTALVLLAYRLFTPEGGIL